MKMMLPALTRAWLVKDIFFPWSLWKSRFHIRVISRDEILEIIKERRKKMTWLLCKGWFIGSMPLCLVTPGFPKWPVSDSSVTVISGSIARTRTCWKLWPGLWGAAVYQTRLLVPLSWCCSAAFYKCSLSPPHQAKTHLDASPPHPWP